MSDGSRRYRQYAGLALVLIAYMVGIIGWSCAVLRVDAQSSTGTDSTQPAHQRGTPSAAASASLVPATRIHVAPTNRTTRPRPSAD